MRARRRLGTLGACLVIGLAMSAGSAAAAGPARSTHDRTLSYWTPARVARASPRDLVRNVAKGGKAKPQPQPPAGGAVTGASWTKGGAILVRSGKVAFTMDSGDYICSGSVVSDSGSNGVSVILTAGHCAFDAADGGFARNWMFIPDFDGAPTYTCGSTVYGCWTARALVVDSGFSTVDGFDDQAVRHDWAFAVVPNGGKTNAPLETVVGSFGISFSTATSPVHAFGYPAAGKFKGKDLVYCSGSVFPDSQSNDETLGLACAMTGGSSGGPWLTSFNETTGSGTLNGLNSYGYGGVKNMYGPKFNGNTQATFARANQGPTSNQIVSVAP